MSKWFVSYNPMCGYIAARKRIENEPIHSGNVEFNGEYCKDKKEVMALVDRLNRKGYGDDEA